MNIIFLIKKRRSESLLEVSRFEVDLLKEELDELKLKINSTNHQGLTQSNLIDHPREVLVPFTVLKFPFLIISLHVSPVEKLVTSPIIVEETIKKISLETK